MAAQTGFESPTLNVGRTPSRGQTAHRYRIAGLNLTVDQPLPRLESFPDDRSVAKPSANHETPGHHDNAQSPVTAPWRRSSRGLVGRRVRDVVVRGDADRMAVELEDLGSFAIELPDRLRYPARMSADELTEALCGPLLPLVLSQHDVYCLHAAALRHRTGLTLLLGASGAGKTTLSRALADAGAELWADDTVAVRCSAETARCPGHYPQPKWPQWRAALDETDCAITHLVLLHPEASDSGPASQGLSTPTVQTLGATEATLGLIEHTLAGRLFSPEGLRRHLSFAATLAQQTQVLSLSYRQVPAALPAMVACLETLTPWR